MRKIVLLISLGLLLLPLMGETVIFEENFADGESADWTEWWPGNDSSAEVVESDTDWLGDSIQPHADSNGYFGKIQNTRVDAGTASNIWVAGELEAEIDETYAIEAWLYVPDADNDFQYQYLAFNAKGDPGAATQYTRCFFWYSTANDRNIVRIQTWSAAAAGWETVSFDDPDIFANGAGWYHMKVEQTGPTASVFVNGDHIGDIDWSADHSDVYDGYYGVGMFSGSGSLNNPRQLYFDDFRVYIPAEEPEVFDYYLTGSFGVEMGGANWDPAHPALGLSDPEEDGIYHISHTFTDAFSAVAPGGGWKITDGSWDNTWPQNGNLSIVADADETVTFYLDTNTYEDGFLPESNIVYSSNLSERTEPAEPTIRGDLNGWDPDDDTYMLDLVDAEGNFYTTYTATEDGTIAWKVASLGEWDSFQILTDNQFIDVDEGDEVYFYMHPEVNRFKATTTPLLIEDWAVFE